MDKRLEYTPPQTSGQLVGTVFQADSQADRQRERGRETERERDRSRNPCRCCQVVVGIREDRRRSSCLQCYDMFQLHTGHGLAHTRPRLTQTQSLSVNHQHTDRQTDRQGPLTALAKHTL